MSQALMNVYARADVAFERGEGSYLFTAEGRRYLDFTSGIAVCALGHAHPHLVRALQDQAAKLWHCSNLFRIPAGERLAERLTAHTFADKVFFCNSGLETFEAAAKLVRKHFDDIGQPNRWRIITLGGSFHGRSLAALAAAKNPKHLAGFAPHVEGFDQVAFDNLNELRAAITDETAAILVEPVQGEGGVRAAPDEYLRSLRAVCEEFGLLLVYDEVQCGMGRTGKLFAHEWAGVAPDLMMVAKGLAGGFPIGAVLATEAVGSAFQPGTHGSTFGGNPLAMACGNAVLDVMLEDGFMERVQQASAYLTRGLEALVAKHGTVFSEVRGSGLLRGLRCVPVNGQVIGRAFEEGLLTVAAGDNVLRLLPPLTVSNAEIDEALAILDRVAQRFAQAAE